MLGFIVMMCISGLIIGALARLIVPGRQPMGILATIGVGLLGSFIGGIVGRVLFGPNYAPGIIMSTIAAAALVWVIYGRRRLAYRR